MTSGGYQVGIVGGGITGTGLLYTLSNFTDVDSVVLIEKEDEIAPPTAASNRNVNSQTLHAGDIETNYDREKSEKVKEAADLVVGYAQQQDNPEELLHPMQKMVLGVGEKEVAELEERYDAIEDLYPDLELVYRDVLEEVEPVLFDGRDEDEELAALYDENGYAADFGAIARSFVEQAEQTDTDISVRTGMGVKQIETGPDGYLLVLHEEENEAPRERGSAK